ncbi:hypothetical protein LOK49_LG12G02468 [Camellia lanceoleosa]|uniref:Uncharacterized protein n=1 Tax=Camellia lanceoleosa TaxID=1840588 RepID=A0ACC0FPL5_9ERIC|nr:hypothetical protein LOK49_LG12G02468 [Camellia lanceoleosa]
MNSFSPWKRKGPEREDIDTKSAALKASPSVVSLTSLTGGKMMFACSGTIIECEDVNGTFINTVLTFATLLRSPIDANAIPDDIKVEIDLYVTNDKPFNGDMVVAIGHSCGRTHALMAASGKFSLDCCKFDCKELFRANCIITKSGIGGPLINRYGEVIRVNFYDDV